MRVVDAHLPAVAGHQRVAMADDVDGVAVEQDSAGLAMVMIFLRGERVQPAAVRSGPAFWRM